MADGPVLALTVAVVAVAEDATTTFAVELGAAVTLTAAEVAR